MGRFVVRWQLLMILIRSSLNRWRVNRNVKSCRVALAASALMFHDLKMAAK